MRVYIITLITKGQIIEGLRRFHRVHSCETLIKIHGTAGKVSQAKAREGHVFQTQI